MKKIMLLLFAIVTLVSCVQEEKKANVRWATFNLRLDTPADSLNNWKYRKERVAEFIQDMKLDVVGTQECSRISFMI